MKKTQQNGAAKRAAKKKAQPKKLAMLREIAPRRTLNLNSPQQGHSVSTNFVFKKGSTPSSIVIEGRDLCAFAFVTSSATPATLVTSQVLTQVQATAMVGRWESYSTLFQRWRVRRLRATLVSNMATTTVGNNYLAWAYDTNAAPASAAAIMRYNGSVMGNAYADIQATFDPKVQLPSYPCITSQTNANEQAFPGNLIFGTDGYSASLVPGKVVIDYELEFFEPN